MSTYNYKVLIADDEYWSRVTLEKLVPWDKYAIEFLPAACDGQEVLERIPRELPDIVITDINMPFVNGLELLQRIQQEHPQIVTIAVSGYDDFDKVKGAFTAGGIDYLLKPVGRQQLTDVIIKAIEKVKAFRQQQKDENLALENSSRTASFIEDSEMSSLLSGQLYGTQSHVIQKHDQAVPKIFIKFHDINLLASRYSYNMQQMSYYIKQQIRTEMEKAGVKAEEKQIFCFHTKVNEFLITLPESGTLLKEASKQILESFPIRDFGPITLVLRDHANISDSLGATYREMVTAMLSRPFHRQHAIVETEKVLQQEPIRLSRNLEKNIKDALVSNKKKELKRLIIEESGLAACGALNWSLFQVAQYTAQINTLLLAESPKYAENIEEREEANDAMQYARLSIQLDGVVNNLGIMADLAIGDEEETFTGSVNEMIEKIHERIENDCVEHFTLSELSEEYHVDASYISRTFSKKYGETISSFIARLRIEKAVALMKENKGSLEEISFEVGYDDYNYFSRVFKKMTGVRPSEYRASQKQGE